MDLVICNIGELATPRGFGKKCGAEQGDVLLLNNACIGIEDGKIAYLGENRELAAKKTIDAAGALVTPGLVDAHTHLVFGGWRQNELALKLEGISYLDILKSGGGILSTVKSTRQESKADLLEKTEKILNTMLQHGTTTCEAKSGYGLSYEHELKQLEVVQELQQRSRVELVSTFMGAHAVPDEYKYNRQEYIQLLCNDIIPRIAEKKIANYCDIFCETSVFGIDETRQILKAAEQHGFLLKLHADEIEPIHGAELAGELNAVSAEHLIQASDQGIAALAQSGCIAVLLPATSFYLDKPYARARKMIQEGVAVAIASDFNPGSSPNVNLQFPMNLACLKYKLTPKEALTAVTLNAAAAIGKSETLGSLEIGKQADILVWDAPDLNYIFYRYGSNQVKAVVKKGIQVHVNDI